MDENHLTIVKKSENIKPLFHKIDTRIDNCYRDCHYKFYSSFELNKKITVARQNCFIFNQISKLTIKIYSNLQSINICFYLKHRIPMCHRLSFRRISQNK